MQIHTVLCLKFVCEILDQAKIKVFSTKESIAISGQNFELLFAIDVCNFNDRDVKSTSAKVIYGNR